MDVAAVREPQGVAALVLVVDDLGRQRCSPAELLNRWIVPLEMSHDYLTLCTGKKISIPFAQTIVFATNLTVSDLADEAFLRRMGYRLYVMPPSPDTYAEIFHAVRQVQRPRGRRRVAGSSRATVCPREPDPESL